MFDKRIRWQQAFRAGLVLLALAGGVALPGAALAAETTGIPFQTHAHFFSVGPSHDGAMDPSVFVVDGTTLEGTGPENVEHEAGLRPAKLSDPPRTQVYNAEGEALLVTLDRWFAARGNLATTVAGDGNRLTATFSGLIPFGVYSLFVQTTAANGTFHRPLDFQGSANSFTAQADGSATIALEIPAHLGHDSAVELIYHSDGKEHGASRGQIGVSAHEQLVAPLP